MRARLAVIAMERAAFGGAPLTVAESLEILELLRLLCPPEPVPIQHDAAIRGVLSGKGLGIRPERVPGAASTSRRTRRKK